MKSIKTYSAIETEALGYQLAKKINHQHMVILLDGDLAAGKTTFTKGIARGLGIDRVVNSPTFTIMKQYESKTNHKLCHLDLYRLTEVGNDFDLEDYINGEGVVVIEWPYQVEALLPDQYLLIKIEVIDETTRLFHFDDKTLGIEVLDNL